MTTYLSQSVKTVSYSRFSCGPGRVGTKLLLVIDVSKLPVSSDSRRYQLWLDMQQIAKQLYFDLMKISREPTSMPSKKRGTLRKRLLPSIRPPRSSLKR